MSTATRIPIAVIKKAVRDSRDGDELFHVEPGPRVKRTDPVTHKRVEIDTYWIGFPRLNLQRLYRDNPMRPLVYTLVGQSTKNPIVLEKPLDEEPAPPPSPPMTRSKTKQRQRSPSPPPQASRTAIRAARHPFIRQELLKDSVLFADAGDRSP